MCYCFGSSSSSSTNMMHGAQQVRFNVIITVSLRQISQFPLFAMPGGVADLCLAGWMSTSAGATLYTVEMVIANGTVLYSAEARGDFTVSKVVSKDRLREYADQIISSTYITGKLQESRT